MKRSISASIILPFLLFSVVFADNETTNNSSYSEVLVEAKAFQEAEGGIASGFLYKNVNLGPLGNKKAIDVPYQINTIPKEIIKNQRSMGLEDVVKYVPSAQIEYRGGGELGRPQTRGMRGDVVANSFWDGFHVVSTTATPMSQFDNLQIQNGLAGSLYGAQNPSGIFNFTLKRPTDDFYNSLLFTFSERFLPTFGADLGGKVGDIFGYRTNLEFADGEGYVKDSTIRRKLASVGLDFYPTDKLTFELNAIYYSYLKEGFAGTFNMPMISGTGIAAWDLPNAVNAKEKGLGQEYAGVDLETKTVSGKVKYEIADNWYAEAGYLFQRADRSMYGVTNSFIDNNGGYSAAQTLNTAAGRFEIDSYLARINTSQELFGTKHDLSLGGNGYNWAIFSNKASNAGSINLGTSNINNPTIFPRPSGWTNNKDYYKSGETIVNSLTLGDAIRFNENWQAMFSISHSWIKDQSHNATHKKISTHSDDGFSYAMSIIYQPIEMVSIYATYADSLQAGSSGTSNISGVNQVVILKPHRSKQYEVGTKIALDRLDFTVALFQIERPIAYQGANGIFEEQGNQKNRGIEFMAAGKLTDDLSLFGGFTYLDTKISGTKLATTNNKQALGMPEWQANMLFEYNVPSFEELILSTNFHYTGKRAIDQANTEWADGYFTMDLGVRYATKKLFGKRTIFRLSVNNLTNEKYWAGIFNSNGLDGNIPGGTSLFLGEPRNISASIEVRF